MTQRNPQLHRIAAGELLEAEPLVHDSGDVAAEVRFFIGRMEAGEPVERLRADIQPGPCSSAWMRAFRLRVLAQFDSAVRGIA